MLNNFNIDVNANNDEAFRHACKYGKADVVKYLLKKRKINVHSNNDEGFVEACVYGHIDVVKYLLKYKINVNMYNEYIFMKKATFCSGGIEYLLQIFILSKNTINMIRYKSCYWLINELQNIEYRYKFYNKDCINVLFPLYNAIGLNNSIYHGII